ncbi:MAG: hypothetical protein HON73_07395 [Thiotrichales bacterium]|jgi:hypothetical protein|nr:hypothetical protein [Thiotrichales bacterium]MBT5634476.1 hypothetical protein [Gammaproteobacteria bacterium]
MKKKKRSISYANYIFTPVESTCIDPMISNRNLEHNIDMRLEQAQGLLRLFLNSEDATENLDEPTLYALWGVHSLVEDAARFHSNLTSRNNPKNPNNQRAKS